MADSGTAEDGAVISLSDFHFLRPWWFIALVPALILLIALWRRRSGSGVWQGVCDPELLPHLLLEGGAGLRRAPLLLLALGWLMAITALSGPVWERQPQPLFQAALSRVVILDLSPSMDARDLKPSRLQRARFKLLDILAKSREGRTALVVFGGEAHLVSPLTDDSDTIAAMIPALSVDIVPAAGDSLLPALKLAAELLERGGGNGGEILLISDGISDLASTLPLAAQLRDQGLRLSVLGVGTLEGAPVPGLYDSGKPRISRLDRSGLEGLARTGGGIFSVLTADEGDIQLLLNKEASRTMTDARRMESGVERWVEQGPWLLPLLLLLAAVGFRRGWLGLIFISVMLPLPPAHALGWDELWSRADQQAAAALAAGDAAAAADLFQQPEWRGVARYQAGDYPGAAEALASAKSGDALYNRGNALARSGALEQALESYDAALKQQPGNKDALFNKQLVEQLLQQQQKKPQGEGEGGSQNEEGEQPQEGEQGGAGDGEKNENREKNRSTDSSTGKQDKEDGEQNKDEPSPSESGNKGERSEGKQQSGEEDKKSGDAAAQNQSDGEEQQQRKDSAAAARRDVEPSAEKGEPVEAQHGQPGEPDAQPPLKERDLALEQWLRQVPDDPAGLLRRKFMLEHLQRQRGEE
ncbi:MAG: VWA domain-containing protein [Sedimenticola sp.]